jgi:hypothetical protein
MQLTREQAARNAFWNVPGYEKLSAYLDQAQSYEMGGMRYAGNGCTLAEAIGIVQTMPEDTLRQMIPENLD